MSLSQGTCCPDSLRVQYIAKFGLLQQSDQCIGGLALSSKTNASVILGIAQDLQAILLTKAKSQLLLKCGAHDSTACAIVLTVKCQLYADGTTLSAYLHVGSMAADIPSNF